MNEIREQDSNPLLALFFAVTIVVAAVFVTAAGCAATNCLAVIGSPTDIMVDLQTQYP